MATHDFAEMPQKRTLKDWERLFNDTCWSITGKDHLFGPISQGERDGGDRTFTFEEALEKSSTVVLSDASSESVEAKAKTIILLKERMGRITPDEAKKEMEELERMRQQFSEMRANR